MLFTISMAACSHNASPTSTRPEPEVILHGDLHVKVELAKTPEQRARGLMFRDHLDAGRGMLFIFEQPEKLKFWMKNTYIPLDMIFIGADKRIVGIVENAVPETETPRQVAGPSQYVLEIGGGLSGRLGIRSGQLVEFRAIPSP